MSKTPWTKGPWTIWDGDIVAQSDACSPIATLYDDTSGADASLIVAAPEMAEAHDENARILGYLVNELQGRIETGKIEALDKCLQRSLAMSAKARGEQ